MIKDQILGSLKKAVKESGYPPTEILLSIPKNPQFGDYTSNIALQLAKQSSVVSRQSSVEIANEIKSRLLTFDSSDYLEKIEVAGGGFINFFIKKDMLANDLREILKKGEKYGYSQIGHGRKVRVEYISANPTGPLHIGNARGGPLGDVIANVLTSQGYEVLREYIDNNVGEQVKALGATIIAKMSGNLLKDNQYQGEYLDELVNKLEVDTAGKSDEEIGQLAVEELFEDIMADAHSMGIKFDLVVHESDLRKQAAKIVEELKKAGVVKEKEGALWLAPSDEFLKDRETVIQKSDGGYTYFTSDIVYHHDKFESGADLIIDVFGANHHGHIPRLQAAMAALGYDTNKLKFILYQYVRVKRGNEVVKMSKRAGNFITAKEVLEEVGVDAFRFYLLRSAPQTHIDFDLELLKQQSNKNPVHYVQYAHARMSSILVKSEKIEVQIQEVDYGLLKDDHELNLIKHLLSFPDLLEELASTLQAHQLTEYAINLADLTNKFYENCSVLQAENERTKEARLALVQASKITLANALKLLGVTAPERM
ncbi:arginine--tRNA ligase [Candidatus Daviesbacteria bacterium RIFCSPLOWO2_01_FULL_39_12]|uniref:Arginine--tRNA ligase n=1 Tax=Candidatus Daviesbacteria bacterium RIFCSPLOWO2_01_FULL_39_12 TaxID=1797785 RepID=A0A1F5KMQ5_9BACT|nr:MAG: arginine--tRNA ligase [Candidatus Daviesbacteria bacterium RIFCSPHIGHO2_02_FULL_39_8]OGE42213.1 MAG: arginine--tRNA ligase [Candidatus Daviesbacteria bacterium RIFCSPLOWO2_01_FULL_39_12]